MPYITLTDGICNLCHEHNKLRANDDETVWQQKYVEHQRQELDHLLRSHQGKGRDRYDALVLFSGGKDSAYMLSRLHKEYPGLRVLLMTWDNGFYSILSLQRCQEVAARLDLDHIVYKPRSSVYRTLYRYTLKNVEMKGSYQTVDRLDGTLNQMLGFYFAYDMNIPLVLAGVDFAQELIMQFHSYFVMPFEDMCSRVLTDRMERRSGFKIADIFTDEDQRLLWDGTGIGPGSHSAIRTAVRRMAPRQGGNSRRARTGKPDARTRFITYPHQQSGALDHDRHRHQDDRLLQL